MWCRVISLAQSTIWKWGHVIRSMSTSGRFMVWGSVLYVSTKFEADSSIRSKFISLKGSQKFKIGSLDLGHSHLWLFCGPYAGRCVIYLRSEIKADSLTRSKVISGSQNLEIGSRDPNPRPFLTLNFELV